MMVQNGLTKKEIKTLTLASLGGALEFYDFIVFLTFIPLLSLKFFPENSSLSSIFMLYGIYAIAYFIRPLSGIIMAHFGDLFGRKKVFLISLFLMAFPTLMIGFLPTYESIGYLATILLFLMRLLQGVALGGEVPSAHVFVTEHVKKRHVGLSNSLIAAGLTFGVVIGYIVSKLLYFVFTEEEINDYAWRLPFILGGLLGFIAIYLRRYLAETPVFQQMKTIKEQSKEIPIKEVMKSYKKETVLGILSTWILTTGVIVILLIPNLLKTEEFDIPRSTVDTMAFFASLFNIIGSICLGFLSDRVGLKGVMRFFSLGLLITSIIFFMNIYSDNYSWLAFLYLITAFFIGIVASVPIIIVRLYKASIRLTGMSLSYNVGNALFSGLTTFLVPVLAGVFGTFFIIYYLAFLCCLAFLLTFYISD